MLTFEAVLPYLLLKLTLVFELVSFLSSHMIDSRNYTTLHEGLFQRCVYPVTQDPYSFKCLWWSADTFNTDRTSLQVVAILAFISLFLTGFTLIFGVISGYMTELRGTNYRASMSIASAINVFLLLIILVVYSFVYAGDTKVIPGVSTTLVFSWSYYMLFGALATNILALVFLMYNPLQEMSCLVSALTFIFLLASIGAQAISFLTSYMVVNRYAPGLHDGIFQRCGGLAYFQNTLNAAGSFISKALDGSVKTFTNCYWWSSDIFHKDPIALQICMALSLISIGVLALILIFFLISLIERFKTKSLNLFLGTLMIINALVLTSILIVYTFFYAKEAKITADAKTPILYSWSYWILYAATAGNFLTSILFCCTDSRNYDD
ncbi:unnamed protein product [Brachionus calyciflorus]|uniref:Uncharacterized protein n=1 Tax=Brachionus calyciflorus TaxID=104777 RepID=A0A813M950_9BILA|nr:unnamed protein product [Brachionus calyciflorus]